MEFELPPIMQNQTLKEYLENLVLKVDDVVVYDASTYPFNFDIKMDEKIYPNKEILEIYDKSLKIGEKLGLIVPNRPNITPGFHNVIIATHSAGVKASFTKYISLAREETSIPTPQIAKKEEFPQCAYCGKRSSAPNQVICEYCGAELN
ncbi:MAG: hypothetical protein ACFFBE_07495 [Promethearchaeota archaeon]